MTPSPYLPAVARDTPGAAFRRRLADGRPVAAIGVYDVFSASIAARTAEALFVSGFGFAASQYGLPDIGFVAWPDVLAFVQRLRTVLPDPHLLVDIDDGYCDTAVACHVARQVERAGASGVVLEDQQRPRRCGHFDGKQILPLEEYLPKLRAVLAAREDLVVVARTDASEGADIVRRARAFAAEGADAVLVDGLRDLSLVTELRRELGVPMAFNQIGGGKSPRLSLGELDAAGVTLVIYSTPCLFAAQAAIEDTLAALQASGGRLPEASPERLSVRACTAVLDANLARAGATARREPNTPAPAAPARLPTTVG